MVAGVLLGVGGALWWGTPLVLRRVDFFRVQRIELTGVDYLPVDTIMARLAEPAGRNVFDGWSDIRRRILALPGVEAVEIRRRLPGTLRLFIRETAPVALIPARGRMDLIDSTGSVLPYDPHAAAPDLPILATPDPAAAGLLGRIRAIAPELFAEVSLVRRVENDVLLTLDRHRLWLSADATAVTIMSVVAVSRDLARRGQRYTELDGRYADQVVVRGRAA